MSRRLPWVLPALLLAVSCTPPPSAPLPGGAEILWDRWGVPHVYAGSSPELFRAFGWAQAESHGDLVLRMYGQARGRAAEYWGGRYLDSDRLVRTLGIPGRADEWYAAQSPQYRRGLDAFAEGINAYARAHPERISDEAEAVLPVSARDVLAHVQRVIHFNFLGDPAVAAEGLGQLPPPAGSNAWAIGPARSESGRAMLLANPHLPWSGIFTWYEAQVVGPGVDAYGVTLVGFPFLGIAFNDHLGWTHTVNTLDAADAYELTLADGGYRWDGGVRPFESREEVIRVRQADGSFREERLAIRSSVHGPVLREQEGKAIAYRVAGLDQAGMVEQYWRMARATSREEFEAALSRLQMPMFTVMYADRAGNIMHIFNGRVPVRPRGGWEYWSGSVRGDTSAALWTATHSYGDLPRVLNPPTGWLQNANDPPWTTTFPQVLRPDAYPAYMAPRRMELRPQRSVRLLMADSSISFDEMIAYKHSTRAEAADRLLDPLLGAVQAAGTGSALRAAEVLARWDRGTDSGSRGAVLFQRWLSEYAARRGSGPLFASAWREDDPLGTPSGLADPAAAVAALAAAAAATDSTFGQLDVAWGEVHRLRRDSLSLPANGGADDLGVFRALWSARTQGRGFQAYGGDSYVAAVEFSSPVRARALLVYGNASQPGSPHRSDQLPLFAAKELRPVWRTRVEIEANLESREAF
jgi:acyl-homoserine-lactone acylase